jgi:hypothetical protein
MTYQLINDIFTKQPLSMIKKLPATFIPFDPANTDAQQFKIWLQEGNIPTSADGETTVTQEEVDAIITLLNG